MSQSMMDRYDAAKLKKRGEEAVCPACRKHFIKDHHRRVFCTTHGSGNCKDLFWNTVRSKKPDAVEAIAVRIESARAAWDATVDAPADPAGLSALADSLQSFSDAVRSRITPEPENGAP